MAIETDNLVKSIAANGVVGAGGAGFPTHVKLGSQIETVIINAAECEPLLHKDKEILRHWPEEIVSALVAIGEVVGAKEVCIGIKGKYTDVIKRLELLMPAHGRVVPLHDAYPSGDEFILVYDVTGKIIPPGGIPLHVGAASINVETVLNIALGKPVTQKFVTVAGAVRDPKTVIVPVGTSLREAIELAGGSTSANPKVLLGGPMMGSVAASLDDPITKTCGGMIVLDAEHPLILKYEKPWKDIARIGASACDQCTQCTDLCPRYLLGHPIQPHAAMRSLGFVEDREPTEVSTVFCCECNTCSLVACPEGLDPKNVCAYVKRKLFEQGRTIRGETAPHRAEMHLDNRRVPVSRLIRMLGLHIFENKGPLDPAVYDAKRVVLPLKQHVGAPSVPTVTNGQTVNVGDLVATPKPDTLGANIHASISGTVHVEEDRIVLLAG